ncbi:hypothetical protein HYX70_03905 [Candidatus Saccharibacteria bacterium]|nr:hypothetical protein [Candidatus Saccharibacteria bacterium]
MLAKTKLLALCCFALVFGAVLFFVTNGQNARAELPKTGSCGPTTLSTIGAWKTPFSIDCENSNPSLGGGDAKEDWFYNPDLSNVLGNYIVFSRKDTAAVMVIQATGPNAYTRFCFKSPGDVKDGMAFNYDNGGGFCGAIESFDPAGSDSTNAGTGFCSVVNNKDGCDYYSGNDGPWSSSPPRKYSGKVVDRSADISKAQQSESGDECNNRDQAGALSFVLCPLLKSITESVDKIVGPGGQLQNLLKVEPLAFPGSSGGINLQASTQNIVYLADGLYVLLFIVLLFANAFAIGIDNYTVKKTLPRLIAAVVLTQFAYIISALMIDAGNILGSLLPNLISSVGGIDFTTAINNLLGTGSQPNLNGLLSSLGAFFLVLVAAIAILVVLIIAMVYMIFRNLFIYILVIAAPIAFAAMVLPGTQKYFKLWGANFIKLILMFPIITSILAVASVLSAALAPINSLLAALIPVVAIALIPKTFKWSGDIMEFTAGAVAGYLGGKASAGRKQVGEQSDRLAESRRNKIATSKFGDTRLGRFASGSGFGSLAGTRKSKVKHASRVAAAQSEADKYASLLYSREKAKHPVVKGSKNYDKQKEAREKALLDLYDNSNRATQSSLLRLAGKSGDDKVVSYAKGKDPKFVEGVMNQSWSDFDAVPQLRPGFDAKDLNPEKIANSSGGSQKSIIEKHGSDLSAATLTGLVSNDSIRTKLDPAVIDLLKDIAANTNTTGKAPTNIDPAVRTKVNAALMDKNLL